MTVSINMPNHVHKDVWDKIEQGVGIASKVLSIPEAYQNFQNARQQADMNALALQKARDALVQSNAQDEMAKAGIVSPESINKMLLEGKIQEVGGPSEGGLKQMVGDQNNSVERYYKPAADLNTQIQALRAMDLKTNIEKGGLEISNLKQGQKEYEVPGMGVAKSKEDAKMLRQMNADIDASQSSIDELIKLTGPMSKYDPNTRAKAKEIELLLNGSLKTPIAGPGTLSEQDIANLNQAKSITGLSLISSDRIKLQELKDTLDRKREAAAKATGIMGYKSPSQLNRSSKIDSLLGD